MLERFDRVIPILWPYATDLGAHLSLPCQRLALKTMRSVKIVEFQAKSVFWGDLTRHVMTDEFTSALWLAESDWASPIGRVDNTLWPSRQHTTRTAQCVTVVSPFVWGCFPTCGRATSVSVFWERLGRLPLTEGILQPTHYTHSSAYRARPPHWLARGRHCFSQLSITQRILAWSRQKLVWHR